MPFNCTVNFADGHRQTNEMNLHQLYTAYFTHKYTRVGQYNITVECANQRSTKTAYLIRSIARQNLTDKIIIHKELLESLTASKFQLASRDDFSLSNSDCLQLRNMITDQKMKVLWRNKTLDIISKQVIYRCS